MIYLYLFGTCFHFIYVFMIIGKYVITDIAEADRFLIKNFDSKGELSQNIADK